MLSMSTENGRERTGNGRLLSDATAASSLNWYQLFMPQSETEIDFSKVYTGV